MLVAEPKHLVESLRRSPDPCGGRASLLGGRNRESQQRRPVFVSVYGTLSLSKEGRGTRRCVPAGGCCRRLLKGWRGCWGKSWAPPLLRLQAQQHGPSSPPLSDGDGAKPRILLPPGKQGCHTPCQQSTRQGWDPSASTTLRTPQGEMAGQTRKGAEMPRA